MKKTTFITAIVAIMMMAVTPAFAQEESGEDQLSNGFQKFNVREDFTENGFQWFHDAELLAAGDKEKSNAMTIGWGGIGTLWGRTALTVYVAEKRYTKEFMDKAEYFTVMTFDVKDSKVLNYMVDQHKHLLKPGDQCIGGGYYTFDFVSNRIILDRESYDFGRPKWHLLEVLKVPSAYRGMRIVYKYDDGFPDDFNVSEQLQIEYYD